MTDDRKPDGVTVMAWIAIIAGVVAVAGVTTLDYYFKTGVFRQDASKLKDAPVPDLKK